ncbi:MAG: cobalamin-dependent protein [Proteobacteria bacterium]|nr:cobalamin-dependent protein [Pseudomonadota bacterium]
MEENKKKIPRVLLAKIGLDGHSRGAYVVADGLKRAGIEVIYTGLRQMSSMVVKAAIEEDVDFIGVSSMAGAHLSITQKLLAELKRFDAEDIPVIMGGIIPFSDYKTLEEMGIKKIYAPGTEVKEIARYIFSTMEASCGSPK